MENCYSKIKLLLCIFVFNISNSTSVGALHSVFRATQNWNIFLLERVKFKCLGKTLTNQNSIQEKMKSKLKSGNACYRWVQNLLSSILLREKLKNKMHRTIILRVVLYGCEI